MYMALATAKHFASFFLLCGILELILGLSSCFDVFRAYRYDDMLRMIVNIYARTVGLFLLQADNYCGHMVKA